MDEMDMVRQLRELAQLHSDGSITDEEFARAKERLLPRTHDSAYSGQAVDASDIEATAAPSHGDKAEEPKTTPVGSGPNGGLAATTSLAGGAVALLAFFALPMASVPLLGSITGSALAGRASRASDVGALALLWLVPIAAAATAGLGAWLRLGSSATPVSRRKASGVVLALSALVVAIYLIALIQVQSAIGQSGALLQGLRATDLTGFGFWLVLGAMVAVGGAALTDLRRSSATAGKSTQRPAAASPQEATPTNSGSAIVDHQMTPETSADFPAPEAAVVPPTTQTEAEDAGPDKGSSATNIGPTHIERQGNARIPSPDAANLDEQILTSEQTRGSQRSRLIASITVLAVVLTGLIAGKIWTGGSSRSTPGAITTGVPPATEVPLATPAETLQVNQTPASSAPVDIGGGLDIWLVGEPNQPAPSAALPAAFTQLLTAHHVTGHVVTKSADDFERDYIAAANRGKVPEILAGLNYLPLANLLDNQKLPVTRVSGPVESVMDRAFVFLPKNADRHNAAVQLAIADNECPPTTGSAQSNLDPAAVDVAERGVRGAALSSESGLSPLLSAQSINFARASAPATVVHDLRICRAMGNSSVGLVHLSATTSTDDSAGRVDFSVVVVREGTDWRILSESFQAPFDELVQAIDRIGDSQPGTAGQVSLSLLQPPDGVDPPPSAENFQYFTWEVQGATDQVVAEFVELVPPYGQSILLPGSREDGETQARIGNSSFGGAVKWRAWAIMNDGSVVLSDVRQYPT